MKKFIVKKSFSIKFIICLLFSILIYLSFRAHLIYENNLKILIGFILILFVIWSIILFSKKKKLSVFFYNLFFIVLLNLIFTPSFYLITFDVPTRQPNYEITKEYKGEFFKGKFHGKGKQFLPHSTSNAWHEGEYYMGNWHGEGRLWSEDGSFEYKGEFQNMEMTGYGTLTYKGNSVTGNWKNGNCNDEDTCAAVQAANNQ